MQSKDLTAAFIELFRREAPPPPTTVRIDLTAPDTGDGPDIHMSWDFFIRIAREIRRAGVEDIVLAHLGDAFRCAWLADAITFAKYFARFPHVIARTDLLTPTDRQIRGAIYAGLDCLVFNFNLACRQWKQDAVRRLGADPDYLMRKLRAAKRARDDFRVETRCAIYVARLGCIESGDILLDRAIHALAEEADHDAFEELRDLEGVVDADEAQAPKCCASNRGCPCWTPFTEAHITADGFLAACRHDYSGRSVMADLNRVPFIDAWHEPSFQRLRRALISGDTAGTVCAQCAEPEPLAPREVALAAAA